MLPDRVLAVIRHAGLNQKDFAEQIGVTGAFVTDILKGRSGLSQAVLIKIRDEYGINVDWLLSGDGQMLISNQGQPAQLEPNSLSQLDQEERKAVENLVKVLVDRKTVIEPKGRLTVTSRSADSKSELSHHSEFMEMTEWDGSVAAGRLGQEDLKPVGKIHFPRKLISERGPFHILKVRGDSMEGAGIHDGDRAIFRPVNDPHRLKPGAIVIVLVDGENTLKRLYIDDRGATLRAENPKYQDIHVNKLQNLIIQGELVYILKKVSD